MFKSILSLVVGILLSQSAIATSKHTVVFHIEIDRKNPKEGKIYANTSELENFKLLTPRSNPISEDKEPISIDCYQGNTKELISFNKIISCDYLTMSMSFRSTKNHDLDVSLQQNIYSEKRWWVVFEWDLIPRIQGNYNIEICVPDDDSNKQRCHNLPNEASPPLILVWGGKFF